MKLGRGLRTDFELAVLLVFAFPRVLVPFGAATLFDTFAEAALGFDGFRASGLCLALLSTGVPCNCFPDAIVFVFELGFPDAIVFVFELGSHWL
jgi:hypothetical protein